MSLPRRLVPGRVHATSRRVARRVLYLTPTPEVTQIVGFSAARGLEKSPTLEVLALMQHTNHVQGVFRDQGRLEGAETPGELERPSALPHAMGVMNSLVARALNTHYGLGENFWSSGSYSNVEIHDEASEEDQLVYAWLQVVKDGLVPRMDLWPGFKIRPEDLGTTITVHRPEGAFFGGRRPGHVKPGDPRALAELHARLAREEKEARDLMRERRRQADRKRGRTSKRQRKLDEDRERRRVRAQQRRDLEREGKPVRDRSTLPESITIKVGVPRGWEGREAEARVHFRKKLTEAEDAVHRDFARTGRTFLGLDRVLAQDPRESAGDTWPTFAINPRVACKDVDTRVNALVGLRVWREEHQRQRTAWKGGRRDVVFPRGTFGMWRLHGALVDAGGADPFRRAEPRGRDAPT